MIEKLRDLLTQYGLARVVIIDDAYDDRPHVGDIEQNLWDRFFDDLEDRDVELLENAYGKKDYDARALSELVRDQRFVDIVWVERGKLKPGGNLFEEFERSRARKVSELEPLKHLIEHDLKLECETYGRDGRVDEVNADFVFLDLFLGLTDAEHAMEQAVQRVRDVMRGRETDPPSVILISGSRLLQDWGPRLRDEADLLGCQFRMMRKPDLGNSGAVVERLYELVKVRDKALQLNSFLLAWSEALVRARVGFMKSIRSLDLADYAYLQALTLEAEGEPVGDYILDLYDVHLHSVLEGDAELINTAKNLNTFEWIESPPAQFMPTPEFLGIMDGALFHNSARTDAEAQVEIDPTVVRLGDVFLSPKPDSKAESGGLRHAYVVITPACDLQHGEADRILVLRGEVREYSWATHSVGSAIPRTPIMLVDDEFFSITWDPMAPETWLLSEISEKAKQGLKRVRRFRTPFVLQIQQAFIGRLGRVGTLAALPGRYAVGARVFVRTRGSKAKLLTTVTASEQGAVVLVGRTEKNALKEWLILSENVVSRSVAGSLMFPPMISLQT